MEIEQPKSNSNVWFNLIGVLCFFSAVAMAYLGWYSWQNEIKLNKVSFLCTKVEQLGKNLDDVQCVQYTAQKHYTEAVALNKTSDFLIRK